MHYRSFLVVVVVVIVAFAGGTLAGQAGITQRLSAAAVALAATDTPTMTTTSTPTPTTTGTPTPTPTQLLTSTPTETLTSTPSASPTNSPTRLPTATPSRHVIREYNERQGGSGPEVCLIQQWSDGVYEKARCWQDPLPSATPSIKGSRFTVPAGNTYQYRIYLLAGQRLDGTFTVENLDINYRLMLVGPGGGVIASADRVRDVVPFSVTASREGEYVLLFDNSYSLVTDKVISVTYAISG